MKLSRTILFIWGVLFFIACSKAEDIFDVENKPLSIESNREMNIDSIKVIDSSLYKVTIEKLFRFSSQSKTGLQGSAIFNNKMFQCHHSNNIIDVIDLEKKKVIYSIPLEPEELVHCNNVNFGPGFYDMTDTYPLLYIQQRGYENKLNAYRIISEGDSIFSAHFIQFILFYSCKSSVTAINRSKNLLHVFFPLNGHTHIATLEMPPFSDKNDIVDIKNATNILYLPLNKVIQDTACDDNYLYFLCGYGGEGELWQINMENFEAKIIHFPDFNISNEPEGIDCYDNEILVSFIGRNVYRIKIE